MTYCPNPAQRWLVAAALVMLLAACGGGGGGGSGSGAAPVPGTLSTGPNTWDVAVDSGPPGTNEVNRLFATVTICQPGSATQCQAIDHIVVDTGSTGLRLLASEVSPSLNLPQITAASGTPLLSCVQFIDNTYAFGPVASADVILGSQSATSVPIQIIADPTYAALAGACSSGTALTTVAQMGAKGIIGMDYFKEDCGAWCEGFSGNGFYYTCTDSGCTAVTGAAAPRAKQLANPVALFPSNNNGFVISLPAVSASGTTSLQGRIAFGIGTQANNLAPAGTALVPQSNGNISTVFSGQTLGTSFIDTGSNGLYFGINTYPLCPAGLSGFYCPASLTPLTASLSGTNGVSKPVSFTIANAQTLFSGAIRAVQPALSGPIGDTTTFDWGLPFFYGRNVFVGIKGTSSPLGTGPLIMF